MSKFETIKQRIERVLNAADVNGEYSIVIRKEDAVYLLSLIEEKDKALEFYANEENYYRSDLEREQGYLQEVMWDRGTIAQSALKSTKEE